MSQNNSSNRKRQLDLELGIILPGQPQSSQPQSSQPQSSSSSLSTFTNEQWKELDSQMQKTFLAQNALRLRDFVGVRERELQQMQRVLAAKQVSSQMGRTRVFQTLPRHMRRRAMSFNLHLLPRHLRKAAAKEIVMPARVKTRRRRKYRRRIRDAESWCLPYESPLDELCPSQNMQEHVDVIEDDDHGQMLANGDLVEGKRSAVLKYNQQQQHRDKRLATHVFHAKRMHMLPLWGYRLAHESTQKIFRVAYRFMRQHCTVHDASYLICLQLESDSQNAIAIMMEQLVRNDSTVRNKMYWNGKREGHFDMSLKMQDGSLLPMGPIRFQWRQSEDKEAQAHSADPSMWLWIHPASLPDSYTWIKKTADQHNVRVIYRNDLARFELRGPHATTLLRSQALLGLAHKHCSRDSLDTWNFITQKAKRADLLPRGMVLALETLHPLQSSIGNANVNMNAFDFTTENDEDDDEEMDEVEEDRSALYSHGGDHTQLLQIPNGLALSKELWSRKSYQTPQAESDASNKIMDNVAEDQEEQRQRRRELRRAVAQLRKTRKLAHIRESIHSILLVQRNDSSIVSSSSIGDKHATGYGAGWDFICSRDVACHFFPKFAKAKNVLPIPLSDRNRLSGTEQCISIFPQDYPKSKAFLVHHRNMHYARYPKQLKNKKPTHLEHQHFSKFLLNRDEQQEMQEKPPEARIAPHADPSLLVMADFFERHRDERLTRLIISLPWGGTPENGSALYIYSGDASTNDADQSVREETKKSHIPLPYRKKDPSTHHHLVGYVTTGLYSLIRGQGHAIGYVRTKALCGKGLPPTAEDNSNRKDMKKPKTPKMGKKIQLVCLNPNHSHYYHAQCTVTAPQQ